MKKLNLLLLIFAIFGFVFLHSCTEEEMPKRKPTVTATPGTIEGEEGEKFTITVNWVAEAGITSLTCSSPQVTVPADLTGTNGSFEIEYTLGDDEEVVTFTIVDQDGVQSTDSFIITVSANVTITDADLIGDETYNFTKDKQYLKQYQ